MIHKIAGFFKKRKRREKWDSRFIYLASMIAGWSKDPTVGVGAVVVDTEGHILGTGYNGLPRGVRSYVKRLYFKATKRKMTVHAEINAVLNCTLRPRGATLYVTPVPPCADCAKAIIQSGIKRVVISLSPKYENGKWQDEFKKYSMVMFREAGVTTIVHRSKRVDKFCLSQTHGKPSKKQSLDLIRYVSKI